MDKREVVIREVGVREGLQIFKNVVSTEQKLSLIEKLSETGLSEIEVTALVRADRVPQMADAEELIGKIKAKEGIIYSALYLNQKGFERGEALPTIKNKGWIQSAVSSSFLKKNSNMTLEELYLQIPLWEQSFQKFGKKTYGVLLSTAFGCYDEGRKTAEDISRVLIKILQTLSNKPSEISLADTIGVATPEAVRRAVQIVRKIAPEAEISLHLHDTRGMGIVNAYAGFQEGVRIFDSSFGGVGGCPFTQHASGNVATEELVFMFEEAGIKTGISLEKLLDVVEYGDKVVKLPVSSKLYQLKQHTNLATCISKA